MSDDDVIDIREILKKKSQEEYVAGKADIYMMLLAIMQQLRLVADENGDYLVDTMMEGTSLTLLAENPSDHTQSMRMTLSMTDLEEWIDE